MKFQNQLFVILGILVFPFSPPSYHHLGNWAAFKPLCFQGNWMTLPLSPPFPEMTGDTLHSISLLFVVSGLAALHCCLLLLLLLYLYVSLFSTFVFKLEICIKLVFCFFAVETSLFLSEHRVKLLYILLNLFSYGRVILCSLFTFAIVVTTVVLSSALEKVKMCPQKPVLF